MRGLAKSYGSTLAVCDVSFDVAAGEILGVLGPNGSGKTTTVECLQGLRRPDSGTLRVLGLDPRTQLRAIRRRVGSQLQDSALPPRIRVSEAVRLFASVGSGAHGGRGLLEQWGLAHRERATFASLSGGERQRLFVALALVNSPDLVFFDEMTTGLDPAARRIAWELVARVRELGTTVVLVTHFMDEAERLCDRIVILDRGVVAATGTPADLIEAHGGGTRASFEVAVCDDLDERSLAGLPGVQAVERRGRRIEVRGDSGFVLHLGHLLVERASAPAAVRLVQPSLEDAYFHLVGGPEAPGDVGTAPSGADVVSSDEGPSR